MPELPDVEGYRRTLAAHGTGHRIDEVVVLDAGVLRDVTPEGLSRAVRGHRFREPGRHGKWLLAHTDGPTVLLHFGMTGELLWAPAGQAPHRHDRVVFRVEDSGADGGMAELRYRDMRKLQGLRLAPDPESVQQHLADLGPDASRIDRGELADLLARRHGAVKPVLTDQTRLAGLGNLLADEILWRARVHPAQPAAGLTGAQQRRLYDQLRAVLRAAVPEGRVPPKPSWLTGVRDDRDAHCPRCGAELARTRVGNRSTVWCPRCQPA